MSEEVKSKNRKEGLTRKWRFSSWSLNSVREALTPKRFHQTYPVTSIPETNAMGANNNIEDKFCLSEPDSPRLSGDVRHSPSDETLMSLSSKGSSVDSEHRSRSSGDVSLDSESLKETSKRKKQKFFYSLRNKARKLRSRSREKLFGSSKRQSSAEYESSSVDRPIQSTMRPKESSFAITRDKSCSEAMLPLLVVENNENERDSGITEDANVLRQRAHVLRSYPFFHLEVVLKEGRDLVIRDSCGTSDPYVIFKIGRKQYYKSRILFKNLNPQWDEKFTIPIEDPFAPISVKVFDYDRGPKDDPMGKAVIDLTSLDINNATDLKLNLLPDRNGKVREDYMGYLLLQVNLVPKSQEDKDQFTRKHGRFNDSKRMKTQIWSSVVNIVLVSAEDLLPMDDNGFSDPYVKFRLGNEKYKSKWKPKTLKPTWLEQFNLHMFDDQTSHLELSVWDHDSGGRDDFMGRCLIDLSEFKTETTHSLHYKLEDGAGLVHLLLTVTGTTGSETVSDLASHQPNPKDRENIVRKYGALNSFRHIKDVGWLQVKVIRARGLAAADIGGKSDPFCVIELVNDRLQTQTEYKTLSPEWGKIFTFNVKDIHSALEITVYDEDRDKKVEFLGKIAIPLIKIKPFERKWFTLKDKKLINSAKGAIELELDLIYNHFKAAIRTFNTKEDKYMQPDPKFKMAIMKRNINRVSRLAQAAIETGRFVQSCFDWESKARSTAAFLVFLIVIWNFELYMLPITVLIIFLKNLLIVQVVGHFQKEKDMDDYADEEDDDDEDDKDREGKKSFKEKLHQIQELGLQIQEGMDKVACLGEHVKNTFNWVVPWLSWLAVVVLIIASVIFYYIPLRYLILLFGINKFTKKLRAPNAIPNNELLDFLSRVPSDKELVMFRELRPDPAIVGTKRKKS